MSGDILQEFWHGVHLFFTKQDSPYLSFKGSGVADQVVNFLWPTFFGSSFFHRPRHIGKVLQTQRDGSSGGGKAFPFVGFVLVKNELVQLAI